MTWMLMPFSASVSNILRATPTCERMPTPMIEVFRAIHDTFPEPVELPSEEGAAEVPTEPAGETDASPDAPVPAEQAPAEEAAPAEDAPAEEAPAEDATGN